MKQLIACALSVVLMLGLLVSPLSWAASSPQTQKVTADTLPLPTGAATESTVSGLSTKLPAAAALQDSTSNPTVTGIGAYLMCKNTTTGLWDECRGTPDPCTSNVKSYAAINGTAGATIITGTSAKKIYVCSLNLVTATTQNINLVSGTGTVCATGTTAIPGLAGGTTAAAGWNLSAYGGLVLGSGLAAVAQVANNADNLCLLTSSSGQISGGLSYVVQ
jgi:hypothetical protein